ncbi:NTP transferase domain-containing protein [Zoogloea sp. 1C4]|uniref:nucleotidyltransferase family protein n=1 Tax=Zoogloea sp. 1C4 TaxID=2570190 RepID=UPI0012927D75|nr:nucleotidyltransferase family protein [Zoogloea sp. 1C4]
MARIVGLLLAAGQGRRFGADKLRQPLADGTPVAVAAARALNAACPESIVVLRPEQDELAGLIEAEGLTVIRSAAAHDGMGYSLAAGVAASPDADGWLVALADMPRIHVDTLRSVADAIASGAALAAPTYAGQRGHPVGFAARWRDALMALEGDEGARSIIRRNAGLLIAIGTDDPGVLQDVDTPADLAELG